MKNIKLLLSVLFFATFSCNNDGDVIKSTDGQGSIIRFGGNIIMTKAIVDNTAFPDNSQIGILGWGYNKNNSGGNMTLRKDLNNWTPWILSSIFMAALAVIRDDTLLRQLFSR